MLDGSHLPARGQAQFAPPDVNAIVTRMASLSDREREVVRAIGSGWSNGEIAAALFLSAQTIKNTITAAYRKLGIADRGNPRFIVTYTVARQDAARERGSMRTQDT